MTDEPKQPAQILKLVPKVESRPTAQITPMDFAQVMESKESHWGAANKAARMTIKIEAMARYLGFAYPGVDSYGWTLARKTEGDAAFRQLFIDATETMNAAMELEAKLQRVQRIASGLRKRLKAERAKTQA